MRSLRAKLQALWSLLWADSWLLVASIHDTVHVQLGASQEEMREMIDLSEITYQDIENERD